MDSNFAYGRKNEPDESFCLTPPSGEDDSSLSAEFMRCKELEIAAQQRRNDSSRPAYRNGHKYLREQWDKHRCPGRYIRWLKSLPGGRLVTRILPPCLLLSGLTVLLQVTQPAFNSIQLVFGMGVSSSLSSLSLSSPFVGLLLVFRTNASYQRFVEGTSALLDFLGTVKSLMRMGLTFFTTEERALNERFLHFMILLDLAFLGFIHEETGEELEYRAQMFRCRGLSITKEEVHRLGRLPYNRRHTYVLQALTNLVWRTQISENRKREMDRMESSVAAPRTFGTHSLVANMFWNS